MGFFLCICGRVVRWLPAKHHTVVRFHPYAQINKNKLKIKRKMTKNYKVVHTGTMDSHRDILRPKHDHVIIPNNINLGKMIKKLLKKKK